MILKAGNSEQSEMRGLSEEEIFKLIDIDRNEPVKEELSDKAIVQTWLNQQEGQETKSDKEGPTPITHIPQANALEALKKCVKFAETCKQYDAAEVMNLHRIQNNFYATRKQCKKQIDIPQKRTMLKRSSPSTSPGATGFYPKPVPVSLAVTSSQV